MKGIHKLSLCLLLLLGWLAPSAQAQGLGSLMVGTNGVLRTPRNFFGANSVLASNLVSVAWKGAVGDGDTDDSAALQAAVDACPSYGIVHFPDGRYKLSGGRLTIDRPMTLTLAAGATLTLACADQGTTNGAITITTNHVSIIGAPGATIRQANAANIQTLIHIRTNSFFTLQGVTLDGNEASQTAGEIGQTYNTGVRSAFGASHVRILDCTFTGGGDRAIDLRGTREIEISGCRFIRTGIDVVRNGNQGNAISCDLAAGMQRCEQIRIIGNYFEHFGDVAIGVPHSRDVVVANNVILGAAAVGETPEITETGISLNGCADAVAVGNVIKWVYNKGITAQEKLTGGLHYPVQNVKMIGNTLLCTNGMETTIIVRLNTLTNAVSTSASIVGNTIDMANNAVHTALYIAGNYTTNVLVANNTIRANTRTDAQVGIKFAGTDSTPNIYAVVGNVIENIGVAIQFDGAWGGAGNITGNTIYNAVTAIQNPRTGVSLSGNYGIGHIWFSADNQFDIGRSASGSRPRHLYLAGDIESAGSMKMAGSIQRLSGIDLVVRALAANPEGQVSANAGSFVLRTDTPAPWFKASGTGNTGWRQIPLLDSTGSLALGTAGAGIQIKETGGAARQGVATLSGGTATVNTTAVAHDSRIWTSAQNDSANAGFVWVSGRVNGTSFTIKSSNSSDDRQVAWMITTPAP